MTGITEPLVVRNVPQKTRQKIAKYAFDQSLKKGRKVTQGEALVAIVDKVVKDK